MSVENPFNSTPTETLPWQLRENEPRSFVQHFSYAGFDPTGNRMYFWQTHTHRRALNIGIQGVNHSPVERADIQLDRYHMLLMSNGKNALVIRATEKGDDSGKQGAEWIKIEDVLGKPTVRARGSMQSDEPYRLDLQHPDDFIKIIDLSHLVIDEESQQMAESHEFSALKNEFDFAYNSLVTLAAQDHSAVA